MSLSFPSPGVIPYYFLNAELKAPELRKLNSFWFCHVTLFILFVFVLFNLIHT